MDNFDHEENTKFEIKGSHDTILMLFHNEENNVENNVNRISVKREATNGKKALNHVLECQETETSKKIGESRPDPREFCSGRAARSKSY